MNIKTKEKLFVVAMSIVAGTCLGIGMGVGDGFLLVCGALVAAAGIGVILKTSKTN